jgi:hypothetical protein
MAEKEFSGLGLAGPLDAPSKSDQTSPPKRSGCRYMSVSGSGQAVACPAVRDRAFHSVSELSSMLDAWQCPDRANPRLQLFRRVDAASFDNFLPAFLEPRQLPPDFRRNVVRSRA